MKPIEKAKINKPIMVATAEPYPTLDLVNAVTYMYIAITIVELIGPPLVIMYM